MGNRAQTGAGGGGENCERFGDEYPVDHWLNWCGAHWGNVLGKILIPSAA